VRLGWAEMHLRGRFGTLSGFRFDQPLVQLGWAEMPLRGRFGTLSGFRFDQPLVRLGWAEMPLRGRFGTLSGEGRIDYASAATLDGRDARGPLVTAMMGRF
jgi:hypothetical protein